MWTELLSAVALVFVIEGIMPFINPEGFEKMFAMVIQMEARHLRIMGLSSMIFGVVLLTIIR